MGRQLFFIAVGGALGAVARYLVALTVQRGIGDNFPYGTAVVNITGCLLFGFFWTILERRTHWAPEVRSILMVGFLGAFTTFSTYMFETGELLRDSRYLAAMGNLLGQNTIGIASLFLGVFIGERF